MGKEVTLLDSHECRRGALWLQGQSILRWELEGVRLDLLFPAPPAERAHFCPSVLNQETEAQRESLWCDGCKPAVRLGFCTAVLPLSLPRWELGRVGRGGASSQPPRGQSPQLCGFPSRRELSSLNLRRNLYPCPPSAEIIKLMGLFPVRKNRAAKKTLRSKGCLHRPD